MKYDFFTKLLHWGIAVSIVLQMLTSLLMEEPEHDEVRGVIEAGTFEVHEWVGLAAFALLLLRWLWGLSGHVTGGWQHLFPWISAVGRKELMEDIRREVPLWFKGKVPEPSEGDAIAKSFHGFGITVGSIMAATGLIMFFGMEEGKELPGILHDIEEVHEVFSNLMWLFLAGHFFMAVFHQIRGHDVLGKMFLLRESK
ncbi:MAG: cytochrome b/b6 domain-containing protein [Mariprofundaceae bacterium]